MATPKKKKRTIGRAFPRTALAAWTYKDAVQAVEAAAGARISDADYDANERYVAGDHWQDGSTWVGPRGTDESWPTVRDAVKRQFTPVGVIGEVLSRVANGLLKREAAVTFAPIAPATEGSADAKAQQAEADAMAAQVSAWWDRVTLWELARTAVARSRALTRGVLRVAVAEGNLERGEDGSTALPTDLTLADAFRRVALTAPDTATAAVIEDPSTLRPIAIVLYAVDREGGGTDRWAQLWTVGPLVGEGDAASLHVRTLPEHGTVTDLAVTGVDRLPVAEMRGALLITEAVRRQQASLDFGESMLVRGMETAGFKERYIANAEPQGTWQEDDPGNAVDVRQFDDGVTRYLVPEVRTLGAAITTELRGIVTRTDDAGETRATPTVTISEPTDPDYAIKANGHRRGTLLFESKQAHILANGEAVVSGYSRDVARADHENDLSATKPPTEGMLRAILEAAVAHALAMTSDADLAARGITRDFLTRFRASVTCHVDAGPLSPEQRTAVVNEYKAGLKTRRSALIALGEEDVDAALAELAEDDGAKLGRLEAIGKTLDALSKSGSYDAAVRLMEAAGVLTPEEAGALRARDEDDLPDDERRPALEVAA